MYFFTCFLWILGLRTHNVVSLVNASTMRRFPMALSLFGVWGFATSDGGQTLSTHLITPETFRDIVTCSGTTMNEFPLFYFLSYTAVGNLFAQHFDECCFWFSYGPKKRSILWHQRVVTSHVPIDLSSIIGRRRQIAYADCKACCAKQAGPPSFKKLLKKVRMGMLPSIGTSTMRRTRTRPRDSVAT